MLCLYGFVTAGRLLRECNPLQNPMDLGTIHARLSKGRYPSAEAVWADIQLVWRNCRTYNEAGSEVFKAAEELAGFAEQLWKQGRLPTVRCGKHHQHVADTPCTAQTSAAVEMRGVLARLGTGSSRCCRAAA